MVSFIIPLIVLFVIIYAFINGVCIYDKFLEGIIDGIWMVVKIFPSIFAMSFAINIFISSGIIEDINGLVGPILKIINFPVELLPLAIMRPISGSSSLIILNDILKVNGADSYVGRVASVLQGSTDTTIYILGLYFSSVGIKKSKYALIVGLLTDLSAIIISLLVVKLIGF